MPLTTEQIDELAAAPQRTTGEEGTVEERKLKDLVDADRYASAKEVTAVPFGMRLAKMRFPSTTG